MSFFLTDGLNLVVHKHNSERQCRAWLLVPGVTTIQTSYVLTCLNPHSQESQSTSKHCKCVEQTKPIFKTILICPASSGSCITSRSGSESQPPSAKFTLQMSWKKCFCFYWTLWLKMFLSCKADGMYNMQSIYTPAQLNLQQQAWELRCA